MPFICIEVFVRHNKDLIHRDLLNMKKASALIKIQIWNSVLPDIPHKFLT